MMSIRVNLMAIVLILSAFCGKADNLYIVGDGTLYGWNLDRATALLSVSGGQIYSGIVYLKAGQGFKFLTVPEWGYEEYGAVSGTAINDGKVVLAKGVFDEGYDQLFITEDANYHITVNTESMTAEFEKSSYQETEISLSSLFLVGEATSGGWNVMDGTPLYQNEEKPYEFSANGLALATGDFKIATTLKGASTWNGEYWYFRDSSNPDRIALNQEGDYKWEITEAGRYDVSVNILDNSISVSKSESNSVDAWNIDQPSESEYYTLTGMKVYNPVKGIYIKKTGSKSKIVMIK